MNDITTTVERIKSANTVPSPDSLPTGAMSSAALLALIDERSETMTETLTPIRQIDPSQPPRRGRGPLLAVAVAAILTLIIGVTSFNILSGDNPPAITEPPPQTTVTTAPAPTTLAPLIEGRLPADTPPLDVVSAIQLEWDTGDMGGAEALMLPGTAYFTENLGPEIAREVWYRYATRMTVERDCSLGTPPELAERPLTVAGADMVTCTETLLSGLEPGVVAGGGRFAAEVAGGWIVDIFILEYQGGLSELENINAYRSWVEENFAGDFATLFNPTALTIIVETPEARAIHRDLVPFFAGDTGPRSDLALPAETPLLDVVTEFLKRWDAGDVEGYAALFHPANGYVIGSDAQASWFAAVTGMTTERTCTEVGPTEVHCDDVSYSGLVPGVVVAESSSVWTGRAGWIWNIEFPSEPFGEPPFVDPSTALGVAEYRDWVQTNQPDVFDQLFAFEQAIRLDTPEVRALHQETIAAFLAATG